MSASTRVNLLPKDSFEYSALGKFVKWAISVGRWILVLTEFVVVCAFLSRFYFDTKLANLFDETRQKKAIVDSALTFENNFRQLQDQITLTKSALAQEKSFSTLLFSLNALIPLDTSLTSISTDGNKISLSGYSLSERGIKVFVDGLISHPDLKEVTLSQISNQTENLPGISFNVSATISK